MTIHNNSQQFMTLHKTSYQLILIYEDWGKFRKKSWKFLTDQLDSLRYKSIYLWINYVHLGSLGFTVAHLGSLRLTWVYLSSFRFTWGQNCHVDNKSEIENNILAKISGYRENHLWFINLKKKYTHCPFLIQLNHIL